MPTPIGHSMAGAAIYVASTKGKHLLRSWKWLVVCMVFAALADIDFLPALFGRIDIANRVHRGPTHTLLFALVISGVVYGTLRILGKPGVVRATSLVFLCMASHLILDVLGKDSRPPLGIPILWPLEKQSLKVPVEIFPYLRKDTYAELFGPHNIGVLAYEILLFGTLIFVVAAMKLHRGAKKERRTRREQ